MSHYKVFFCCLAFCLFGAKGWTQSAATSDRNELKPLLQELKQIKVFSPEDASVSWTLFEDETNHAFFIDFDHFDLNLKQIIIRNELGKIIQTNQVLDLPVDTIFELSFKDFPSGFYTIEVHSFINVFSKSIYLQK